MVKDGYEENVRCACRGQHTGKIDWTRGMCENCADVSRIRKSNQQHYCRDSACSCQGLHTTTNTFTITAGNTTTTSSNVITTSGGKTVLENQMKAITQIGAGLNKVEDNQSVIVKQVGDACSYTIDGNNVARFPTVKDFVNEMHRERNPWLCPECEPYNQARSGFNTPIKSTTPQHPHYERYHPSPLEQGMNSQKCVCPGPH